MMDTCCYTFVQIRRMYTTRVNSEVNCGLRRIRMCQCRFIPIKNWWLMLVSDTDNGRRRHGWEQEVLWEISVASPQLCCKPKLALNKTIKKQTQSVEKPSLQSLWAANIKISSRFPVGLLALPPSSMADFYHWCRDT